MSSDDQQAPNTSPSIEDLAKAIFLDDPMAFDEYRAKDALKAVEAMGDDKAVDFLAEKVLGKHPDQYIRSAAAMALGRLGNPRAASALKKALNDPSTSNVVPAVRFALGKLGEVEAPASAPSPQTSSASTSGPPPSSAGAGSQKKPWWRFWE